MTKMKKINLRIKILIAFIFINTLSIKAYSEEISFQDRQSVLDLISYVSLGIDNYDVTLLMSIFTDDGAFRVYQGETLRREALNYSGLEAEFSGRDSFKAQGRKTRHFPTGTIMNMEKNGTIETESMLYATEQFPDSEYPQTTSTGVYKVTAVRTEEGWKLSKVEMHFDF